MILICQYCHNRDAQMQAKNKGRWGDSYESRGCFVEHYLGQLEVLTPVVRLGRRDLEHGEVSIVCANFKREAEQHQTEFQEAVWNGDVKIEGKTVGPTARQISEGAIGKQRSELKREMDRVSPALCPECGKEIEPVPKLPDLCQLCRARLFLSEETVRTVDLPQFVWVRGQPEIHGPGIRPWTVFPGELVSRTAKASKVNVFMNWPCRTKKSTVERRIPHVSPRLYRREREVYHDAT